MPIRVNAETLRLRAAEAVERVLQSNRDIPPWLVNQFDAAKQAGLIARELPFADWLRESREAGLDAFEQTGGWRNIAEKGGGLVVPVAQHAFYAWAATAPNARMLTPIVDHLAREALKAVSQDPGDRPRSEDQPGDDDIERSAAAAM